MSSDRCNHCGGLMMKKEDEDLRCSSCGRSGPAQVQSNDRAVVIDIQLRPKTLGELIRALALAENRKPAELLEGMGLTPTQAKKMVSGELLYPKAVVGFVRKYAVTPSQLFTLAEGASAVDATNGTGQGQTRRGGRRPNRAGRPEDDGPANS